MARKKTDEVEDSSLCAMGIEDPTERKIMARAMKAGEDQINIVRESRNETQEESDDS